MAGKAGKGRTTFGLVDGGGLYFSRIATAGPYAFMASLAVDESGRMAADALVDPPYHLSPPAHAVAQTRYIFNQYVKGLEGLGSGIDQVVQVEQHIPHKIYADPYIDTSRGPGFMERGRPTSALLCTGDLEPRECVIIPTGIAVLPTEDVKKEIPRSSAGYQESLTREQYGDSYAEEGPFNEVVTAGPYVFTVGDVALDWETNDIEASVKVSDAIWWGSEIRNETDFLLTRLESYLNRVGAALADVVHTTIYLTDIGDYFELDRVWKRRFPENPPARTVVPCRGLGAPRLDAPGLGHQEKAVKIEHLTQSLRPGFGAEKEIVSTGGGAISHESEAVKAGPLLWISQLAASGKDGLQSGPDIDSQLDYIFQRMSDVCKAGGTALANLVRLRAFLPDVRDAYAVYRALRERVPSDPPTVAVCGVPGPLPLPGCSVIIDGIAYVGA
jgi:enamine deaminase RidA (YjgF/YER057c/UK114 family)